MVKQNVIEDAKQEGINQNKTEMVKKLLEQKVSYEIIATSASISALDVSKKDRKIHAKCGLTLSFSFYK